MTMTFRFLRWMHRRGVSRSKLKGSLVHRWLGNSIFSKDLWAFRREPLARGWLIGSLVGSTPLLGLQLLMGLPAGLYFRANLFDRSSALSCSAGRSPLSLSSS